MAIQQFSQKKKLDIQPIVLINPSTAFEKKKTKMNNKNFQI